MGTKIETYQNQKIATANLISDLNKAQGNFPDGKTDKNNDKAQFDFYDRKIWDSDTPVYLHAVYGYYGSSSAYAISGEHLQKYLIKAVNAMKKEIIAKMIEFSEEDRKKALLSYIIAFSIGVFFGMATMCFVFYARGDDE